MRRTTKVTTGQRLAAGLAAAALTLTACGSDSGGDGSGDAGAGSSGTTEEGPSEAEEFADQSPDDIQQAAFATMRETAALRLAGTITTDGDEISLDVQVAPSGDCTGTVSQGGGTSEFTQVGERGWIRPDAKFWQAIAGAQADQIIQQVGDKWVTVPSDGGSFDDICDVDSLLDELAKDGGEVSVGDLDEVDGRAAVPLSITGDDAATMWVAAEEPHHILRVESDDKDEPGRLTFSDFDTDLTVEPPPAAQVADLG